MAWSQFAKYSDGTRPQPERLHATAAWLDTVSLYASYAALNRIKLLLYAVATMLVRFFMSVTLFVVMLFVVS
jgi:hypothetical protein